MSLQNSTVELLHFVPGVFQHVDIRGWGKRMATLCNSEFHDCTYMLLKDKRKIRKPVVAPLAMIDVLDGNGTVTATIPNPNYEREKVYFDAELKEDAKDVTALKKNWNLNFTEPSKLTYQKLRGRN